MGTPPAPRGGCLSQACRAAAQDGAESGGESARAPALSSGAPKGSSVPFGCATWCGIVVGAGGVAFRRGHNTSAPAVTTPTQRPGVCTAGPSGQCVPLNGGVRRPQGSGAPPPLHRRILSRYLHGATDAAPPLPLISLTTRLTTASVPPAEHPLMASHNDHRPIAAPPPQSPGSDAFQSSLSAPTLCSVFV